MSVSPKMLNCPFKGLRGKRSSQWCFRWQSSVVDLSLLRCFVVHPAVFPLRSRSTTAGDWLWLVALLYHHPPTFVCVLLPVSGDITHITLLLLCSLITSVFALLTNELCRYRLYKKSGLDFFDFVLMSFVWRTLLFVSRWRGQIKVPFEMNLLQPQIYICVT